MPRAANSNNNTRIRSVCFTLNNYSPEEKEHLIATLSQFKYAVFQEERGENGTPHLQGYVQGRAGRTFSAWKSVLGDRTHIERANGSSEQNRAYCTKDSDRIPGTVIFEHGVCERQGARNDIAGAVELLKEGRKWEDIIEQYPDVAVKYFRGLQSIRLQFEVRREWKTEVFWFYGPTGSGKSRKAFELYPEAYYKMPTNKWWDGYDRHEVVVIDDYRRDLCSFGELLRLFDRYPLLVELKGGTANFVAKTICVTTPKSPRETWEGRSEEDLNQLLRRIEHVVHYPGIFANEEEENNSSVVVQGRSDGNNEGDGGGNGRVAGDSLNSVFLSDD